uniref:Uncharacterized protein n=1 Tax=Triticum urartu TaxID=4572 RepID=A0A8R7U590_TRIUA
TKGAKNISFCWCSGSLQNQIFFSILNKEQLLCSSQVLLGTESVHDHERWSCKKDYPILSGAFQHPCMFV